MTAHGLAADGVTARWSLVCSCAFCREILVRGGWITANATTGTAYPMTVTNMPAANVPPARIAAPVAVPAAWANAQRLLCSRLTNEQIGCIVTRRWLPVRSAYNTCYLIPALRRGPAVGVHTYFCRDEDRRVERVTFSRRGYVESAHRYCIYPRPEYGVPPGDGLYTMVRMIETDPVKFRSIAVSQGAGHSNHEWLTRDAFDVICPPRKDRFRIGLIDRWLRMLFGGLSTE